MISGCWSIQFANSDNSHRSSFAKLGVVAPRSGKTGCTNRAFHKSECPIGTKTLSTHNRKIKLKSKESGINNVEIFGWRSVNDCISEIFCTPIKCDMVIVNFSILIHEYCEGYRG